MLVKAARGILHQQEGTWHVLSHWVPWVGAVMGQELLPTMAHRTGPAAGVLHGGGAVAF